MQKYPRVNDNWDLLPPLGVMVQGLEPMLMLSKESQGEKQPDLSLLLSFFFLPRLLPPDPMGSQKAKGLGITIHLGRPSRTQNKRASGVGGATGQEPAHVSENTHLQRQEEEWKKMPRPCIQRTKAAGVLQESTTALSSVTKLQICMLWACACVRAEGLFSHFGEWALFTLLFCQ